ncbi:hypothetical protein [Desulfotomaculum copahuensis]|uniref:Uncharacterized protein n=1 Tax=Desulfotomaculum copahuensis TaxID=1838280 RepID=A0A1B7LH25_9FIRM|nr:hypothetical protein [Desulfotomaculum copahuensis]OAT85483.1 hypothetical protein A6M21_06090 [Desulfotomaculum copahuensis]
MHLKSVKVLIVLFVAAIQVFSFFISVPPARAGTGLQPALQAAMPPVTGNRPADIQPAAERGRVVMVIIDRLSIGDLAAASMPHYKALLQRGALGLMNGNTAGGQTPENTCATIGAGAHIAAPGAAALGFDAGETMPDGRTAAKAYRGYTGRPAPAGSLVELGIGRMLHFNQKLPYPNQPGATGAALHAAGLKTAALGNADTPAGLQRQVVLTAMDDKGLVDYGDVSADLLVRDPAFPGGMRTDYDKLLSRFAALPPDTALTVIETGDLSRLEDMRQDITDAVLSARRQQSLQRVDNFLGRLSGQLDFHRDLLLVLAPTPGGNTITGVNYLTPVLAVGAGVEPGLLTSSTTKRPGIIMSTDLAPTIFRFFGLPVNINLTGQPLQVFPSAHRIQALQAMQNQLAITYTARPVLQKGYIFYQFILLLFSLYCIFWRRAHAGQVLAPFLLSVMVVPLVYLLLPLLPQPGAVATGLELLLLTVMITVLTVYAQRFWRLDPFILLCFANAFLILGDALCGSPLQKNAILGYDPIVGARFYGIGNEYMGILIGSILIGTTALLTRLPHRRRVLLPLTGLFYLISIYILSAPFLGTKVGGAIVMTGAFLTTFLLLLGVRFNWRTVLLIAGGVIVVLGGFMLYDLHRPLQLQSHIGRNTALVLQGGWPVILDIIRRKSEMNIRLVRYTIWSRILLASIGSLAILFYRPVGVMAAIRNKYPDLYKGFIGVTLGSILAFIFNDSGVVAAATTMVFGAPPMVYLVLQEQRAANGKARS